MVTCRHAGVSTVVMPNGEGLAASGGVSAVIVPIVPAAQVGLPTPPPVSCVGSTRWKGPASSRTSARVRGRQTTPLACHCVERDPREGQAVQRYGSSSVRPQPSSSRMASPIRSVVGFGVGGAAARPATGRCPWVVRSQCPGRRGAQRRRRGGGRARPLRTAAAGGRPAQAHGAGRGWSRTGRSGWSTHRAPSTRSLGHQQLLDAVVPAAQRPGVAGARRAVRMGPVVVEVARLRPHAAGRPLAPRRADLQQPAQPPGQAVRTRRVGRMPTRTHLRHRPSGTRLPGPPPRRGERRDGQSGGSSAAEVGVVERVPRLRRPGGAPASPDPAPDRVEGCLGTGPRPARRR